MLHASFHDYADVTSMIWDLRLGGKAGRRAVRIKNLPNLKVGKSAEIAGENLTVSTEACDYRGKVVVCFGRPGAAPARRWSRMSVSRRPDGRKPFACWANLTRGWIARRRRRPPREADERPSWWTGFRGAIQTAYNVDHWPTVYVIDPKGATRRRAAARTSTMPRQPS